MKHANPASCSSYEEQLIFEVEQLLEQNDVAAARRRTNDPVFKSVCLEGLLDDALFECCERGQRESVALLLELGVTGNARPRGDRGTPLHVAAKHCHTDIVRALLGKGADPEARMRHNITPLLLVCDRAKGLEAARLLLAANASPDTHRDSGGTPLAAAASWGHTALVDLLLKAGARVDGPLQLLMPLPPRTHPLHRPLCH
jgi:ankyrin repeat protein